MLCSAAICWSAMQLPRYDTSHQVPTCLSFQQELCTKVETRAYLLSNLKEKAVENKLRGFEVVKGVYLETMEWQMGTDYMTPSSKLVRNKLQKRYQAEIDAMYDALKK